jgi:hypothetical protein
MFANIKTALDGADVIFSFECIEVLLLGIVLLCQVGDDFPYLLHERQNTHDIVLAH